MIHCITGVLMAYQVNIATMKVFRQEKHTVAYMVLETDQEVPAEAIEKIAALDPVLQVKFIKPF